MGFINLTLNGLYTLPCDITGLSFHIHCPVPFCTNLTPVPPISEETPPAFAFPLHKQMFYEMFCCHLLGFQITAAHQEGISVGSFKWKAKALYPLHLLPCVCLPE